MKKLLLSFLLLPGYQLHAADSHALQTDQVKQTMQTFQQQHVGIRLNQDKTVTLRFVQPEIIIIIPAILVQQCEFLKNMFELFSDNAQEDIQEFNLTPACVQLLIDLFSNNPTIKRVKETLSNYNLNQLVDLFMAATTLGYQHPNAEIDIIEILQEKVTALFFTAVHNHEIINPETLAKIQATLLRDPLIEELFTRAEWQILHTFQGHNSEVNSVAFSPDGKFIATASADRTAKLWDVTTGQCIRTLQVNKKSGVSSIAFSPNGRSIATTSYGERAKLWDVATGARVHILESNIGGDASVAFNRDSSLVVTASWYGTAIVFDARTGGRISILKGHTEAVVSTAFSPDGRFIATASRDKTAKLWEVATGKCVRTLQDTHQINSVAFSPDGRFIATASDDGTVKLWNTETGASMEISQDHISGIESVAFSPDGLMVATASRDKTAKLWKVATGECVRIIKGHTRRVSSVAFSPNGTLVVTASDDNTAKLWGTNFAKAGLTSQQALNLSIQDVLHVYNTGELPPKSTSKAPAAEQAQEEDSFAPAGPADQKPAKPKPAKKPNPKKWFSFGNNDDDDADED